MKMTLEVLARRINRLVEWICALLVGTMVLVIWFGVVERYFLHLGFTWTEEFSRYVMIWAALLAVSCGAYYREHIGLDLVRQRLPAKGRRYLMVVLDTIGAAFFVFMAIYGLGMASAGRSQYAPIFGMTMVVPFASVPVASALAAFQILAAMVRDFNKDWSLQGEHQ